MGSGLHPESPAIWWTAGRIYVVSIDDHVTARVREPQAATEESGLGPEQYFEGENIR